MYCIRIIPSTVERVIWKKSLYAWLLVCMYMVGWFLQDGCDFGSFHEFPIRFSGAGNPNPMSDFQNSETLLSDGIPWKASFERFRDEICESWRLVSKSQNSMSHRQNVGNVGTLRILDYFLNLIADSDSPTPKTPESTFPTQKKIHTWRTDYSLDCREGLAHKNKFVCLLACMLANSWWVDLWLMNVIFGVFMNSLLGFRGRGIRIRCQICKIPKHYWAMEYDEKWVWNASGMTCAKVGVWVSMVKILSRSDEMQGTSKQWEDFTFS